MTARRGTAVALLRKIGRDRLEQGRKSRSPCWSMICQRVFKGVLFLALSEGVVCGGGKGAGAISVVSLSCFDMAVSDEVR